MILHTPLLGRVLDIAEDLARKNRDHISPDYVCLAILDVRQGIGYHVLEDIFEIETIKSEITQRLCCDNDNNGNNDNSKNQLEDLLRQTRRVASEMEHSSQGTQHLLVAFSLVEGTIIYEYLSSREINTNLIRKNILDYISRIGGKWYQYEVSDFKDDRKKCKWVNRVSEVL